MKHIRKHIVSGEFTLKQKDENGRENPTITPPRYSPHDKYGKYRRLAKRQSWQE
ncbi:MAG: nucleolar RNA-binding Nop10p family protein [Candidatus Woesearchaeota archaeon]